MKLSLHTILISLLCFSSSLHAQYNEKLAEELGADEYGMKSYVLVTLITGPAKNLDKETQNKAFQGHFANMRRLGTEKKLVVAGPFIEAKPKRGLFIFNTDSIEQAESWVKTDPAVQLGIFDYEIEKIYSSAALMQVNKIHETLQKKPIQ